MLSMSSTAGGLSDVAREACDGTLSIAQFGSTRSINASAAAAMAMHAWVRQHADLTGPWRG
jgi:tRNA G18 (ribose-2'-O)-methylase SpoU